MATFLTLTVKAMHCCELSGNTEPLLAMQSAEFLGARACLGQLGGNSGEGHGGGLARGAIPVAPVPNLVSGQEVARPVVAPPLEGLEPLILKHLLLYRTCSYSAATCELPRTEAGAVRLVMPILHPPSCSG